MTETRILDVVALRERAAIFADRADAGRQLAKLVATLALTRPLVLAIPAGGLPVAAALAEELGAPLDVAVVSKITLPWNSEAGYGAVAFDGSSLLNEELVAAVALDAETVAAGVAATRRKVERRVRSLRGDRPMPPLAQHDLILVDDGLASGLTMLVAVAALRRAGATSLVVAVPTGHAESVRRLAAEVDTICCANIRGGYSFAVASAYRQWRDVSEAEALQILKASSHPLPNPGLE